MTVETNTKGAVSIGRSKTNRLLGTAMPAGAMTLALFMAMDHLVKVDDFEAPELTTYELVTFEPIEIRLPNTPARQPVKRLDPVSPPPSQPKLLNEVNNVKGLPADYRGAAPEYRPGEVGSILPKRTNTIQKRHLLPIMPPVPVYPRPAISRNLEGYCEVSFSVSIRGEPFGIQADCTDRVFKSAAIKAVKKVKFAPQIRDGLPVTVTGVVYPLEFRLKQ
ncbi:MAG: energy transducer TonB [Pseudomonadota bacterium]